MNQPENINQTIDHLFRREAGKMVSVLTKVFGTENLQTAEDVVQDTLLQAFQVWSIKGIPDNPSAWMYTVAKNKAINIINKNKHTTQFDFTDSDKILLTSSYSSAATMDSYWKEELVKDDMLRMMFACCHPDISEENQITIILKLLCGFSTAEIAKAFLTSEDTISKRLYRTKEFFRQHKVKLAIPSIDELQSRTNAVLHSIYLLFNEGYNSTHNEELIRRDLVGEALMLCKLLTDNQHTHQPETYALMALMCFHTARMDSRLTAGGEIILLERQDRTTWNQQLIKDGNTYMNLAAFGNSLSTYHIEAAIAYEHCIALNYANTNWQKILEYYNWLCQLSQSSILLMNRAVAVMQLHGANAALIELEKIPGQEKLKTFYLYHSIKGEMLARLGNTSEAQQAYQTAIQLTQSATEKKMLQDKIAAIAN